MQHIAWGAPWLAHARPPAPRSLTLADHAYGIEPLLELFEKQARDAGLGDLPYPPDYPKMPGEPMRVQPSRARANKDADAT